MPGSTLQHPEAMHFILNCDVGSGTVYALMRSYWDGRNDPVAPPNALIAGSVWKPVTRIMTTFLILIFLLLVF